MNAQLTELCEQLRSNGKRAQTIVSNAGEARLAVRPRPDSWSAAECLVHLTLSTEMFLPAWRSAFADARAEGILENGPFKMDLVGKLLQWTLQPPPKFRIKAPPNLQPVSSTEVLSGFLLSQAQLLNVVSESIGLALDRVRIASPARVRFSVWSSFRVTDAHQRRHLGQPERALGLSK